MDLSESDIHILSVSVGMLKSENNYMDMDIFASPTRQVQESHGLISGHPTFANRATISLLRIQGEL